MEDRELRERLIILDSKISEMEEYLDLLITPGWKRFLYWLNGWPYGKPVQCFEQKWRFWHRWYGRRDRDYK